MTVVILAIVKSQLYIKHLCINIPIYICIQNKSFDFFLTRKHDARGKEEPLKYLLEMH